MSIRVLRFLRNTVLAGCVAFAVSQAKLPPPVEVSGTAQAAVLNAMLTEFTQEKAPREHVEAATNAELPRTDPETIPEPKTLLTRSGSHFVYPRGCAHVDKRVDVVFHFHGVHTVVIPSFIEAQIDAVLVVTNRGIGSGIYSDTFQTKGQVDALLERTEETIQSHCGGPPRELGRIALSSWSAGYGAIQQILRLRPEHVDAVLLADGLHVGFTDARSRQVPVDQIAEFATFAQRAADGKTLMAITHAAILPPGYAGAGETAMALIEAVSAPVWPVQIQAHEMRQLTAARKGQFFVDGFAGRNKRAHARQLHAIGHTTFARLHAHWQTGALEE